MSVFGKKSLNPGDPIQNGGPGDDAFNAPAGSSGINGFAGIDTVAFNFRLVDATVTYDGATVIIDTATSHTELTGIQRYVFTDGTVDENDGNALVDDLYYYSRNHDLWTANGDAEAHFAQFGWQEGRNPSAFFNTKLYLVANSDVRAAGVDPLEHFHTFGWKEGRLPSISFDTFQYLQNNPDVAAAGIDPLEHFLAVGRDEGRASYISNFSVVGPSGFDEAYYLLQNPDVEAAGVDPLEHFLTFGWREGRNPNAWFDTRGYLATYTDVAAAGVNPFEHYLQFGWKEGRNPLPAFDTEAYLLANPDVAAAGVNPLIHYLQYGVHEGRSALSEDFNTILNPVVLEGSATGTVLFPGLSWGNWISPLLSFTLTGDSSGGGFAVNSATGALTVANGSLIDFETSGGAHTLTVLAQLGSLSKALTFTVGVTDAPPTISSNAPTGSILEGAANGTTVGITVTGSDPNGPAPIFTLANDAGGRFTIDASGVISVANGAAIDFETAPGHTYSLTARATVGALSADLLLTINVGDVNDNAPVFTSTAAPNVAENTTPVVTLTTTDADTVGTNPPTFSITGGADQALFTIVGGNQLQFIGPRDFEVDAHGYAVQVTANDGANSTVQNLTLTLTDTDDNAPAFTSSATPSVAENVTAVVVLAATDADTVGGPVTFAITGGADAALFTIVGGNQLQFVSPRDFETQAHSYDVQVTASDSVPAHNTVQNLTVTLTDTNDNAPVFTSSATPSVAENTTAVVTLTATDADTVGGPTTFLITGGADQALFQIVGGQLQFVAARDFETQAHSYAVEVTANDGTNNTVQNLTVTLTDTNDNAPVFTSSATPSVAENATAVVTLTATDADTVGGSVIFAITGGADAVLFQIVGGNQLQFVAARDFETQAHSYAVEVTANDGTNNTVQNLTVTLTDTNDNAPVFTSSATPSVAENTTAVVTLAATDADTVGGPTTFLITGGADQALFQIVGGQLEFVAARDFETQAHSYAVEVTANDGTNNTVQNLTVTLTDTNDSAPVFTSSATPSVAENTTAVVTLTATDADTVGGPTTFLITGGADAGLFQIVGGQLQFVAARDFETQAHSYAVEVTANDGTNNTVQNLTVTLTDTDDNAPVFTSSATPSVAENATAVVMLAATDADTVGGPVTFAITGGADQALFTIVGNELQLVGPRDFETQAHSYDVQVTASDSVPTHDTVQNLTVTLTDTDDNAPVFTSSATPSVAENTTAVVMLAATDADTVGGPVTFAITGGADQALFTIVGNELQLVGPRDFETQAHSYDVQVTASDSVPAHDTVQNLTVTLTDTNDSAPVFTSSATPSVAENTTAVVTLAATDADTVGGPVTFAITGGADAALFQIVGGQLQFVSPGNFETQQTYAVQVTASDSVPAHDTVQNITVTLTNLAPVFAATPDSDLDPNQVSNGSGAGVSAQVDADASDPAGGTVTYALIDAGGLPANGGDRFTIDPSTGVITVSGVTPIVFDSGTPANNFLTVTVRASDPNGAASFQDFVIEITPNAAPIITSNGGGPTASVSMNENATVTGVDVNANDPDNGPVTPLVYSIAPGGDGAQFTIDSGTGVLTFNSAPNFENPTDSDTNNTYVVTVRASDGAAFDDQTITVTVNDVAEAPVIGSNGGGPTASITVNENQTAVTDVDATDPDLPAQTLTYLLVGGTDQAKFNINSGTGVLTFISAPNFESPTDSDTNNTYVVTVRASDGTLFDDQTITVTVNDVAEAPVIGSNGGGPTASITVNENQTAVTDVDATDPDLPAQTLTYSLVGGTDQAKFNINSGTGVLTFISAPNFESPTDSDTNNTYVVTVRASDGTLFDDQTITVTVNDVAEAPVIGSNGGGPTASITVNENQTAVTDVDATDPDLPAQTLTYSLVGGTDQAKFNINSGTGVLTFISAPNFESPTDSDTNNSYVVTVRASDGTLFDDQTITVTVANVNEQPTLAATGATIPYTEDTPSEDHAVTLFTGVAVSAVEPGQNLDQLVFTVSNVLDLGELLSIDGSTVPLVAGNSTTATNGMSVNVAFTGNTATVTVEKSGGISAALMQTLIAGLAYSNTDESPTFGARVVTLVSLRDVGSNTPPNDNIFENIGIFSTVNVAPVNDAPVVTAPGAVNTFIEGAGLATGTPVFVDTAFTVADTDNDNMASATVSITAGLQTGDVLSFTPQFGITDTNAAPEILALSGSATKAQWETVLRSITFATSTQDPTTSRTISIQISDGTSNSNTATKNVTITPVNDEPTLTATANGGGAVTFTETSLPGDAGSGPVDLFSSPTASTVEAGQAITQLVVTVTNVVDATEFLMIGGTAVDLVNGNSEAVTGGTASVSIAGGTATVTITPTTTFTTAQVQTLVDSLAYDSNDNTPTATTHTISVTSLTDNGANGGANGNDNTGSPTVSTVVTVVPTNDAPVAADFTFNGTNAAIGNTSLVVNDPTDGAPDPAGPQKTITGDLLAGATDVDTASTSWTITAVGGGTTVTDANGTIIFQPDGDFTYLPAAGVTGNVVYQYQVNDNDALGSKSDTGQITINIATPKVWYVNAATGSDVTGDGTSDNPFASLTKLNGVTGDGTTNDDVDGTGDIIFLYGGTYTGGIVLEDGQQLISKENGLTVNGTVLEAADGSSLTTINGTVTLANTPATANNIQGIDFGNTSGFALTGTNVGNATVNTVTSGQINNTTGGAINIDNSGTGMNLQFTSVSSTGSSTNAISFNQARGTFNSGSGTLSNATGNTVNITASGSNKDLAFTYGGAISDDGNLLVNITGQTGGTKTFGGTLTDGGLVGGGINVSSSTGGTVNFNGQTTLSTGANTAVNLSSNTGATINFNAAGNGLDITTTTGTGFSATGGGTVNVTQVALSPGSTAGNTITSGNGTALKISDTTIGASNVTFQSLSSNGGTAAGIILINTGTSGGLVVTGLDGVDAGTLADAGSGGTIANKTGGNVWSIAGGTPTLNGTTDGVGIYMNNTKGASFSGMQLNDFTNTAVSSFGSSNFSMTDSTVSGSNGNDTAQDESSLYFYNLTGTGALTRVNVSGGFEDNLQILNTSGTLNRFTVDASTFGFNNTTSGNNSITVESRNAGTTLNFTLQNSTIKGARADWINASNNSGSTMDVKILTNIFDNLGPEHNSGSAAGGNRVVLGAVGAMTFDINGNTLTGSLGEAIRVRSTAVGAVTGTATGYVRNNTIGDKLVANSGSSEGSGIFVFGDGGSDMTIVVDNNDVFQYNNSGIRFLFGDEINDGSLFNATVKNNVVNTPGTINNGFNGFLLTNGSVSATDNFTTRIDISNNDLRGGGRIVIPDAGAVPNDDDLRVNQRFATHVELPGYLGTSQDTAAVVAYLLARGNQVDGASDISAQSNAAGGYFNTPGGAPPAQPPFPLLAAPGGIASAFGTAGDMNLSQHELDSIVGSAINNWAAAGVTSAQLALLRDVSFTVADLAGGRLAEHDSGHIWIDLDAAGYGWFIDPTPGDNAEFPYALGTNLFTDSTQAPAGHMDLLTAIMHEMGHELGLDHNANPQDVMFDSIVTGERRLPSAEDAAASSQQPQGSGNAAVAAPAAPAAQAFVGHDIVGGFDAEYYLAKNPDVAAAGVDPHAHYETFGWHEGRNPNAFFDTAGYLAHYADVATAGVDPLQHYEEFGWKEGRDPSAGFDTQAYLAANPDVAAAHVNPLDHYLHFGVHEGRSPLSDGIWG